MVRENSGMKQPAIVKSNLKSILVFVKHSPWHIHVPKCTSNGSFTYASKPPHVLLLLFCVYVHVLNEGHVKFKR